MLPRAVKMVCEQICQCVVLRAVVHNCHAATTNSQVLVFSCVSWNNVEGNNWPRLNKAAYDSKRLFWLRNYYLSNNTMHNIFIKNITMCMIETTIWPRSLLHSGWYQSSLIQHDVIQFCNIWTKHTHTIYTCIYIYIYIYIIYIYYIYI